MSIPRIRLIRCEGTAPNSISAESRSCIDARPVGHSAHCLSASAFALTHDRVHHFSWIQHSSRCFPPLTGQQAEHLSMAISAVMLPRPPSRTSLSHLLAGQGKLWIATIHCVPDLTRKESSHDSNLPARHGSRWTVHLPQM